MPVRGEPASGPGLARRTAARVLLGVACVAAALVPAVSDAAPSGGPPGDPAAPIDYVALGDSFTAGPLVPRIRLDPPGCIRSTANYPAFLAAYLQVRSYTDVSCSGAATADLRAPQPTFTGTNPPQLDALTRGTDLVTIGIGGNDHDLFESLTSVCPTLRAHDPSGAPCRERFTVRGVDTLVRDARRTAHRIGEAVRDVRARAPHAAVVVVGYPRFVPARGTCPRVLPLADGDYRWADQVERALNRSLRRAAQRGGARYVDIYRASRGHAICAGVDAWVNGAELAGLRAFPYHPFRRGMRAVADRIYWSLTGEEAPQAAPRRTDAPAMTRRQQRRLVSQLTAGPPGTQGGP